MSLYQSLCRTRISNTHNISRCIYVCTIYINRVLIASYTPNTLRLRALPGIWYTTYLITLHLHRSFNDLFQTPWACGWVACFLVAKTWLIPQEACDSTYLRVSPLFRSSPEPPTAISRSFAMWHTHGMHILWFCDYNFHTTQLRSKRHYPYLS